MGKPVGQPQCSKSSLVEIESKTFDIHLRADYFQAMSIVNSTKTQTFYPKKAVADVEGTMHFEEFWVDRCISRGEFPFFKQCYSFGLFCVVRLQVSVTLMICYAVTVC